MSIDASITLTLLSSYSLRLFLNLALLIEYIFLLCRMGCQLGLIRKTPIVFVPFYPERWSKKGAEMQLINEKCCENTVYYSNCFLSCFLIVWPCKKNIPENKPEFTRAPQVGCAFFYSLKL